MFSRLRQANLKLKPSKCVFARPEISFLGHKVSRNGISPLHDKVDAIKTFPLQTTPQKVRSFLGLSGYYRKFIPKYSAISRPLYNLTGNDILFNWTEECQTAFDKLKSEIVNNVVLAFPDFSKPFTLATDASTEAIVACLSQYDKDDNLRLVAFVGRALTKSERNFSVTELNCLLSCTPSNTSRCT